MAVTSAVQYFDLSACKGIKIRCKGEFRYQEIRPEICHFSLNIITLEHDHSLECWVGEEIDLQIDLGTDTQTFRGRVVSIVRQKLWNENYHNHTWFQYIIELESEMPHELFHRLSGGARRSWWSFRPNSQF